MWRHQSSRAVCRHQSSRAMCLHQSTRVTSLLETCLITPYPHLFTCKSLVVKACHCNQDRRHLTKLKQCDMKKKATAEGSHYSDGKLPKAYPLLLPPKKVKRGRNLAHFVVVIDHISYRRKDVHAGDTSHVCTLPPKAQDRAVVRH
jgi:hypothetical protein